MATLTINGKTVTAPDTMTIMEAAMMSGIKVPHLCKHPALSTFGGCRLCVVSVKGMPKPVASCTTAVSDGMEVTTSTPEIESYRKMVLELILSDHPNDCMTCEATGSCMLQELAYEYGAKGQVGQLVAITLVREPGPVLTAVLVAGRNASGMASELGSMKVTEQIDAMRALGTDPVQKLVTPRLIATCTVLPLLTIIADFVGLFGGFLIAYFLMGLTASEYWSRAWQAIEWLDVAQGLVKPFIFAFAIALVGCY